MTAERETRLNEWFVPKFGPMRFRVLVGLLFLPYTGMCISFAVIGSFAASSVSWERVGAIALIYGLALGVGAHAADSIGSRKLKPWGSLFSKKQLVAVAGVSLVAAYAIGVYYIVYFTPLLAIIAVLEGFFLLAYNLELFGARFHNDFWFCVSWGFLPVMAGYVIQTNAIDAIPVFIGLAAGLVSYLEIKLSRPYKELKRRGEGKARAARLEVGLKLLSISTISVALVLLIIRIFFS